MIFLELLDEKQDCEVPPELQISDETRQKARELYRNGVDAEYVHIYVHCMEKIEVLHNAKIIHGDIKPDIFMNNASVVCDFSRSWSWEDNKPCLDKFNPRQGPRSFETRKEGERKLLQKLVLK
jgi:serine/threonine protein kinase